MMIWPKHSSSPSILTRRSMASLIDSSRPLCTLTTYQRLLLGGGGGSASDPSAEGGAAGDPGGSATAVPPPAGGPAGASPAVGVWASSVVSSSTMEAMPLPGHGPAGPVRPALPVHGRVGMLSSLGLVDA